MKKNLFNVIALLIIGHVIAIVCHLVVIKNVTRKEEIYNKYCTYYEKSCECELGEYGILETGFPFVSGRDDKYPCNRDAAIEERAVLDFERSDGIGFLANNVFWSFLTLAVVKLSNRVRIKK